LEGRFTVEWIWSSGLDRLDVIPFLIQPLVENAIKHGIAPSERGGQLVIMGDYEREWVRLDVRNTGLAPGIAPTGTGIGLRNLKGRLELAYHNRASLELKREGEWTVATLILPLTEHPHE
jgi:LytS/YehU family sensor histidine kinase